MKNKEGKIETVTFRLDAELLKKLEVITSTENKKMSSVAYDACLFYAELYPSILLLKSLKLNPQITINEEEIKKKIYDKIKEII